MTDTLLHLRRSENGHFVLVEPTSQTVVVAEELGEAYARMCETLKDPPAPAPPHTGSPGIFAQRGAVRLAIVAVAILAPLAWVARISVEVREAELTCPPPARRAARDIRPVSARRHRRRPIVKAPRTMMS